MDVGEKKGYLSRRWQRRWGGGEGGSEFKERLEQEVVQGMSRRANKTWAFLAHTRKGLFLEGG